MTRKEFSSCLTAGLLGSVISIGIPFSLINLFFTAVFFIVPESDPDEQISFLEFIIHLSQRWPTLLQYLAAFSLPVFFNAFFVRRALLRNTVNEHTKFDYALKQALMAGVFICCVLTLWAYIIHPEKE